VLISSGSQGEAPHAALAYNSLEDIELVLEALERHRHLLAKPS